MEKLMMPGCNQTCCPTDLLLASFLDFISTPGETMRVKKHLEHCPRCLLLVADLREVLAEPAPPMPTESLAAILAAIKNALSRSRLSASALPRREDLGAVEEIITREGFARFAEKNHLNLIRYFLKKRLQMDDAEDLAQETFLVIWQKRRQSVPPHHRFLLGIARRHYFAHLRQHACSMKSLAEAGKEGDARLHEELCAETILEPLVKENVSAGILGHLAALSQKQRKVVQMIHMNGLSMQEAANELGISKSSVQTHARRAIAVLKQIFLPK